MTSLTVTDIAGVIYELGLQDEVVQGLTQVIVASVGRAAGGASGAAGAINEAGNNGIAMLQRVGTLAAQVTRQGISSIDATGRALLTQCAQTPACSVLLPATVIAALSATKVATTGGAWDQIPPTTWNPLPPPDPLVTPNPGPSGDTSTTTPGTAVGGVGAPGYTTLNPGRDNSTVYPASPILRVRVVPETRYKSNTAATSRADMSKFDPVKRRQAMRDFGIQFALSTQYEPSQPMGNIGRSQVELAIGAWLVGFENEIAPVLPRALEWIEGAIEGNESFGESLNFHKQNLWWGKAIAFWMLNGSTDVEAWDQARQCHAAAAEEGLALIKQNAPRTVFTKERFPTYRLDDYLALCVEAQQYALGIEEFEKYHEPASLQVGRIKQPRELGYIICMHALGRGYDAEAVFRAGQRVLRAHLDGAWLSKGQFIRAATWLKIVYSVGGEKLTALETVQKAHDYL